MSIIAATDAVFSPLSLTVKGRAEVKKSYKIYVEGGKFLQVTAETVTEALHKAKVDKPLRIEKSGVKLGNVVNSEKLVLLDSSHTIAPTEQSSPIPITETLQ